MLSEIIYRVLIEVVMKRGPSNAALHLKIAVAHEDRMREGVDVQLKLSNLKMVFMPRQWFLKQLDLEGKLSVPKLRHILEGHIITHATLLGTCHR